MRKTREILRLKWELRLSHRGAARSVGVSPATVDNVLSRAEKACLSDWAAVEPLPEDELEARLYERPQARVPSAPRVEPDCAWIHRERRRPGVTMELLHKEYLEQHPNGLRYSAFCERYRAFTRRRRLSMRQQRVAGDKVFVDTPAKSRTSSTRRRASSPRSSCSSRCSAHRTTHTRRQQVRDFVGSHVRAFAFLGGVPRAVVPDNLKSGVTKACRYEPALQRSYAHFAEHYRTAILPARPAKPRDKAKVEVGVRIAQRWILGRLRNRVFHLIRRRDYQIRLGLAERRASKGEAAPEPEVEIPTTGGMGTQ